MKFLVQINVSGNKTISNTDNFLQLSSTYGKYKIFIRRY